MKLDRQERRIPYGRRIAMVILVEHETLANGELRSQRAAYYVRDGGIAKAMMHY